MAEQTAMIKVKPGVPEEMDPGDTPTYEGWLKRVDNLLFKHFGIVSADLPDCNTYDWWSEERLRPIHAANRILENAAGF